MRVLIAATPLTGHLNPLRADVNARVAWSGVGIDLATNSPTREALRKAVHAVLENPDYSSRASAMAAQFGKIDTRSAVIRILEEVSGIRAGFTVPASRPLRRSSARSRSESPI